MPGGAAASCVRFRDACVGVLAVMPARFAAGVTTVMDVAQIRLSPERSSAVVTAAAQAARRSDFGLYKAATRMV